MLQGYQRFHALAAVTSSPRPAPRVLRRRGRGRPPARRRPVRDVPASVDRCPVRPPLIRAAPARRREARPKLPFLRYLGPVVVGLVGIAVLTHVDILVVKARFSGDEAGAYAAASAFARVGFFLPGDHPRRHLPADGRPPGARRGDRGHPRPLADRHRGVLRRPRPLLRGDGRRPRHATFGADFAEGGEVLAPFALATGLLLARERARGLPPFARRDPLRVDRRRRRNRADRRARARPVEPAWRRLGERRGRRRSDRRARGRSSARASPRCAPASGTSRAREWPRRAVAARGAPSWCSARPRCRVRALLADRRAHRLDDHREPGSDSTGISRVVLAAEAREAATTSSARRTTR